MSYLVYADGASRGNPGPAAYGAVVLNSAGTVIAEMGENLGIRTNNYAEYQGAIAGLRYVEANFPGAEVELRMDSKLVIEQLSGRWQIKHPELRELAQEAHRVMRGLQVRLTWVPREENSLADAAGNRALDEGDFGDEKELALAAIQPKSIRAPRQSIEPTTVVVVRHGHTAHTESNLISGSSGEDPTLSELGFREAELAAEATTALLKRFGLSAPEVIYHSPQLRTTQTAEAFAKQFNAPLKPDARFKEIAFGDWEGYSMDQMETSSSSEIATWRGSMTRKPPGGESVTDLESRVLSGLDDVIAQNSGKTVAIVAHMMPLRAIARKALDAGPSISWALNFSPASVSIYRFFGNSLTETFVINACEHLPKS